MRSGRGWSQADLARESGIVAQTISAIETQRRPDPSASTLVPIADALRVSLGYLVTGIDDARVRIVSRRQLEARVSASDFDSSSDTLAGKDEIVEVQVAGECMEPTIAAGDWVRVDPAVTPTVGSVVVLRQNGELTLKRLRRQNGKWLLVPDNPAYPPLEILPQSADVVGVVVNVVKGKP